MHPPHQCRSSRASGGKLQHPSAAMCIGCRQRRAHHPASSQHPAGAHRHTKAKTKVRFRQLIAVHCICIPAARRFRAVNPSYEITWIECVSCFCSPVWSGGICISCKKGYKLLCIYVKNSIKLMTCHVIYTKPEARDIPS